MGFFGKGNGSIEVKIGFFFRRLSLFFNRICLIFLCFDGFGLIKITPNGSA